MIIFHRAEQSPGEGWPIQSIQFQIWYSRPANLRFLYTVFEVSFTYICFGCLFLTIVGKQYSRMVTNATELNQIYNDLNLGKWTVMESSIIRCIRVLGFWQIQTHCRVFCSRVHLKSTFLLTMYLGCVWKRVLSREKNSAPESRRVTLPSVKVIKMSRLTIILHCCETHHETDFTTLLSLETQDIERGQLRHAQNYTRNACVFDHVWYVFVCVWLKVHE